MTRPQLFLLVLVLLLAAALRFTGLDWDSYKHYHPDERYVSWVATTIEWPRSWATAFQPHQSSFNPFYWPPDAASQGISVPRDEPRDFAYGHLPLYLGVAAARLLERLSPLARFLPDNWLLARDLLNGAGHVEFDHLTVASRALTALVDAGTVLLAFLLGRRLYGVWAGLLAASFLAVTVAHIQLAHFFAVDPYLTFFTVAALLLLVRASERPGGWQPVLLAAAAIGLAIGAKFSAIMLFLPLALLLWRDPALRGRRALGRLLLAAGFALLVFALTNPFALLDWSCQLVSPPLALGPLQLPALNWGNCYAANVLRQSDMVGGSARFPFTMQYAGTAPFLYPVAMQMRWGMGPLLGLVAFAGGAWVLLRALAGLLRRPLDPRWARWLPPLGSGELILLAFALPYFLSTGSFFVKFMRYMQPLLPLLSVFGAGLLLAGGRRYPRAVTAASGIVFAGTALFAFAFVSLYRQPHPWLAASTWLHENAPQGAVIAGEKWDETLPSSVTIDGQLRSRNRFANTELDWLGGAGRFDDPAKVTANLEKLAGADYLVIASNRGYGVAGRLPELYPLTRTYYDQLFGGNLGFEVRFVAGRAPQLGQLWLWPDRFGRAQLEPPPEAARYLSERDLLRLGYADESFTVYDQPFVMVFGNSARLSAKEMMAALGLAAPEP
jgi:4-amino-4-deoxy-L-arabinose transferase-like glycosyltransferase